MIETHSAGGLLEAGDLVEAVSYSLVVSRTPARTAADGTLTGGRGATAEAFNRGRGSLVLKDGTRLPIVITGIGGDGHTTFASAGVPIPPQAPSDDPLER